MQNTLLLMAAIFHLLLLSGAFSFALVAPVKEKATMLAAASNEDCIDDERNAAILALVDQARQLGPVANDHPENVKAEFHRRAKELQPLSDTSPAAIDLTGVHERIYSISPGKKYGHIQQIFVNATSFVNSVKFLGGIVQTSVDAYYKAQDDVMGMVIFDNQLYFRLFGLTVYRKELPRGGEFPWKVLFVGNFVDHDGKQKRLRIMETPSLFVLLQNLE